MRKLATKSIILRKVRIKIHLQKKRQVSLLVWLISFERNQEETTFQNPSHVNRKR